ncbi:MAG: hypothetical protein D6814_07335, partial [Calditrichaeota bacterium]
DTHYYFWYLTKSSNFPLTALFLIGSIQMVTRLDRRAFFAFCNFTVPVLLLSFVFSYRIQNYIFHIYPFYLMLAAYGLVNLFDSEFEHALSRIKRLAHKVSQHWVKIGVFAVVFGWLPLTVWFRYALKLPYIVPTGMNGAVDHLDWRGATDYVKAHARAGDVVVSTLPLTVLYYLGHVEYNLNQANLDTSLDWRTGNGKTGPVGFYSGAPAISNVQQLRQVMQTHPAGWLILDTYRMQRDRYVPQNVAKYIRAHLRKVWTDRRNTVEVYHWPGEANDPDNSQSDL